MKPTCSYLPLIAHWDLHQHHGIILLHRSHIPFLLIRRRIPHRRDGLKLPELDPKTPKHQNNTINRLNQEQHDTHIRQRLQRRSQVVRPNRDPTRIHKPQHSQHLVRTNRRPEMQSFEVRRKLQTQQDQNQNQKRLDQTVETRRWGRRRRRRRRDPTVGDAEEINDAIGERSEEGEELLEPQEAKPVELASAAWPTLLDRRIWGGSGDVYGEDVVVRRRRSVEEEIVGGGVVVFISLLVPPLLELEVLRSCHNFLTNLKISFGSVCLVCFGSLCFLFCCWKWRMEMVVCECECVIRRRRRIKLVLRS